jgi:hypothetical protein
MRSLLFFAVLCVTFFLFLLSFLPFCPQSLTSFPSSYIIYFDGPSSSVGITNDYGLDGPGSNSGGDVQIGPGAHPASCKMSAEFFPGVKCGRGVLLTTHPLLVPRSWKSRAIPLPTLWATPGL